MIYDIIGDIHGHAKALTGLLQTLGYSRRLGGHYAHRDSSRIAVFVGDIVDRGPSIPEAVRLVRSMVEAGAARAVLGNHEYNLIAWHTRRRDQPDRFVRAHTPQHHAQCRETLQQYSTHQGALHSDMDWMMGLPLFLDLPQMRVVHAAWHPDAIRTVADYCPHTRSLDGKLLQDSAVPGTPGYYAVEQLLKGIEVDLPLGVSYRDKEGTERRRSRTAWWITPDTETVVLNQLVFPPGVVDDEQALQVPIPRRYLRNVPGYHEQIPVFMGHYWLTGSPHVITTRIACVDYSIAAGGCLAAYTFRGEQELTDEHFTTVDASGRSQ